MIKKLLVVASASLTAALAHAQCGLLSTADAELVLGPNVADLSGDDAATQCMFIGGPPVETQCAGVRDVVERIRVQDHDVGSRTRRACQPDPSSELRQNTKSVRLSAVHDISSLYASVMLATGGDKDNADVWVNGLHEYEKLGRIEKARFLVFMGVSVRTLSEQFFQWKEGALDEDIWKGMRHVIDDFTQYEGFRAYWTLRSHQFSDSFRAYVDTALARAPAVARPLYDGT